MLKGCHTSGKSRGQKKLKEFFSCFGETKTKEFSFEFTLDFDNESCEKTKILQLTIFCIDTLKFKG